MANYYSYNTNQVQADINMDNAIKDMQNQLLNIPTDSQLGLKANQTDLDTTNVNVAANTSSLVDRVQVTYLNALSMPSGFTNFIRNDQSTSAQTQNSNALNYFMNNTNLLDIHKLYFPKGTYYFNSTVTKTSSFIVELIGAGNGQGANSSSILQYTGTGTFISLGTDDGNGWSANEYNGPGNLYLTDIYISGGSNGTLYNNMSNYGIGQIGIADWRGGSLRFNRVVIQKFEVGLQLVQSDYNQFRDILVNSCKTGIVLGARSDQNLFIGLNTYYNEVALWVDGARGILLDCPTFVSNVAQNYGQIVINNSSRDTDVTMIKPWLESGTITSGVNPFNSIISVGVSNPTIGSTFSTTNMLALSIMNPAIQTTNNSHLLSVKFGSQIDLVNVPTNGYYNLFDFIATTSDYSGYWTYINLINSSANKGSSDFTVSGSNSLLRVGGIGNSYGTPNIETGSQNTLVLNNPYDSSNIQFISNYGFTGLNITNSKLSGLFLQFRGRIFYGTSVPSGSGQSYAVGDICFNQSGSGYIGWVCIVAGSPGTWSQFGILINPTSSAGNMVNGSNLVVSNYSVLTQNPTSSVTGVTMSVGTYKGQELTIINNSTNTITFDIAANSHVANGASCVINGNMAKKFVWNTETSLWYPLN